MAAGTSAPKPIRLTRHAEQRLRERAIAVEWVETTIRQPDWVEADPLDPAIERRFRAIPAQGGRILQVACAETDDEIRVITLMFDRDARPS